MECQNCHNETDEVVYAMSYPQLISREQECRGVIPTGDFLLKVCPKCNESPVFHNPEFPPT